jgi:septal ring factor EnvC (AmiA/AmiB activator)
MPTVAELLDKKHQLYLQLKAQNQKLFDLYQEYEAMKTNVASLRREYEAIDRELFAATAKADAVNKLLAKYSLEQLEAEATRRGIKIQDDVRISNTGR